MAEILVESIVTVKPDSCIDVRGLDTIKMLHSCADCHEDYVAVLYIRSGCGCATTPTPTPTGFWRRLMDWGLI